MFDPTALSARSTVVKLSNGMYRFRGAYSTDGPVEFFPNRPMVSAMWTSRFDLEEVADAPGTVPSVSEQLTEWDLVSESDEIDVRLRTDDHD